jgi:hypothetical protein
MLGRNLLIAVIFALLVKLSLFALLLWNAPEGRFLNDSADYIEAAQVLSSQNTFARHNPDGSLRFDLHRAPGYALFLSVLRGTMKLPFNAVILFQILLALSAAWFVYRAACLIDRTTAFLSALIVMYDPAVSIYSLFILSETLFFFMLACFMFAFVKYLKGRQLFFAAVAALLLALATYVRPITYYLGVVLSVFTGYANLRAKNIKAALLHTLVFLVVFYGLLEVWQARNYRLTGVDTFASVIQGNPEAFGVCGSLSRTGENRAHPAIYYAKAVPRCLLSLFTRPGQFKYFRSKAVSAAGKALAYPWMVFWITGLAAGIIFTGGNIFYQFILCVILYFTVASIGGAGDLVGERFRVPMVPFIAVLSAYGWSLLYARKRD